MVLSYINFFKGIFTLVDFFFGTILGLIFYIKAKKLKAKLLSYMSLMIIFGGLVYSVMAYDFLIVVFTDKNIHNPYGLIGILTWIWAPIISLLAMYVATELLFPSKLLLKRLLRLIILTIGIIFAISIIIDPIGNIDFNEPSVSGEDIFDPDLIYGSSAFIIGSLLMLFVIFFCGIGYLYKSVNSEDVLKKKLRYLAITSVLYGGSGIFDGIGLPTIAILIARSITALSFWFWYLSLREEHIEPTEITIVEEIEVEESIFILFKRPEHLDEDEVTFHRERKICLVCKKKVGGINFICTNCATVYCEQCARSLINLENACWVCNTPIDPSKPVKPFKLDHHKTKLSKRKKKFLKSYT